MPITIRVSRADWQSTTDLFFCCKHTIQRVSIPDRLVVESLGLSGHSGRDVYRDFENRIIRNTLDNWTTCDCDIPGMEDEEPSA